MRYSPLRAILWICLYVSFAVAPVLIAYTGSIPESRSFWVELGVGLGFIGLAIMGLQFVLTGRFRSVAATLGLDAMLQFHRQIGLVGFFLILAHPIILFLADTQYLAFLDPRENVLRALALSAVIGALILIVVTTLWREAFRFKYEWWRLAHGVLALFIVLVGLVHILQVGFYVATWWKQTIWVVVTVSAMALLVNTRVIAPWKMRNRPFRVAETREEHVEAWTLSFEPVGHTGFSFMPGQFGWLILGESPFSLRQHPFSFSSSALRADRVEMTIKALGDFTSTIGSVKPGQRAYIEGPYGAFIPDPTPERGAIFLVAGVGITPIMSMLRTFHDRADPRELLLIYGNRHWNKVLFREELDCLRDSLNLRVVHVLSSPPDGWEGESGRITPDLLDRLLPAPGVHDHEYFVCGPEPMMDGVEPYLLRRGVPIRDVYSERFKIV
jgi:predicted ferric reductase